MRIDEIFKGVWRTEEEFVIKCPFCGDRESHHHCHVNVRLEVFHCFVCGEGGRLFKLFREAGLKEQYQSLTLESNFGREYEGKEQLDFSLFPRIGSSFDTLDRLAQNYLEARDITAVDVKQYDIRYADSGRFYGRVLIPIFEALRVVCFVGRSFLSFINPKYLFPCRGETLLTTGDSLFGYDNAVGVESVVIVEGVFDAISANKYLDSGHAAVALCTNHLSKTQLAKLLSLNAKLFIVMLDAEALLEGINVAKQLSQFGRVVRVSVLPEGDPSSLGPRIKEGKLYDFDWELEVFPNLK